MADVKFSELTSLAAADVAADDILAIVDTGASTSKKLSIDNLFGAVPVNIAQTDATDATSSAGAVRTAGGVSMAKKLYVGTTSTLVGAVTATAGVFPATQDGAALGSGTLQFSDLFLADGGTVTFGDDSDTTLTHTDGSGILLNSTNKIGFGTDFAECIHSSTGDQLDIDATVSVQINAPTVDIDASTEVNISNDLVLSSDSAQINFGADEATQIIHTNGNGIYIGGTEAKLGFGQVDFAEAVFSSTDGQLDIVAGTEVQIVATTIDVDGGLDLAGATFNNAILPNASGTINLGSASAEFNDAFFSTGSVLNFGDGQEVTLTAATTGLTLNDDKKLFFRDSAISISSGTDTNLEIVADGDITAQATDLKVGIASADANIQALTDAYDLKISQFNGNEVARVTDGAKAVTGFTTVQTDKGGFGYRRQILEFDIGGTDTTSALTMAESGAMIRIDGTNAYNGIITLPAVASDAEAGVWYEFIVTTALQTSKTVKIKTNSHASGTDNDIITLYSFDADSGTAAGVLTATAPSGGNDIITIGAAAAAGTVVKVQNVVGGTAEQWVAYAYVPDSTATTTVGSS